MPGPLYETHESAFSTLLALFPSPVRRRSPHIIMATWGGPLGVAMGVANQPGMRLNRRWTSRNLMIPIGFKIWYSAMGRQRIASRLRGELAPCS
jgi:hypothetical protein